MTKLRMAMTALGLVALISGAPRLHADDTDKGGKEASQEGKAWGHGHEGMKEELGLSDDQAKQLKEAREANEKVMKPLMEKLKLDLDSLRVLVDKKAADADLKSALDGLKADHKAMEEQRAKQMEGMALLLTPMQQAKWAVSMADHMMQGGMMGGHGHGMGPKDGGKDKDDDDKKEGDKD
jgi:Spy/CpxP family protein refolding chaperone